jgi:Asp-tRNA(Asn)/Glu-tRNA(Gln) amidotransferase A subunit family amidase
MASQAYRLTATEVVSKIRHGEFTVEQYARSLLDRIAERDSAVKAWAYLNPDLVLEQAKKLDQVPIEQRGPLHGVAIAVKDVIYTKGENFLTKMIQIMLKLCASRYAYTIQLGHLQR